MYGACLVGAVDCKACSAKVVSAGQALQSTAPIRYAHSSDTHDVTLKTASIAGCYEYVDGYGRYMARALWATLIAQLALPSKRFSRRRKLYNPPLSSGAHRVASRQLPSRSQDGRHRWVREVRRLAIIATWCVPYGCRGLYRYMVRTLWVPWTEELALPM